MAQPPNSTPLTLITGASEGLGAAMATQLARRRHNLILVARNEASLTQLATNLTNQHSVQVTVCAGDLTDQTFLDELLHKLSDQHIQLSYAINNAGMGLPHNFDQSDPKTVANLCDLNLKAVTYLTHGFLRHMLPQGGTILNIGSLGGFTTIPHQTSYYASKTYIHSLSQGLNFAYRRKGVRICCACPGTVATKLHAKMGNERGLYLKLFPPQTPERTATKIVNAMIAGRSLYVPGILNSFHALAMRLIPNWLLMPFISLLFKRPKP